jgi:ABC-type oligopeptide transport system substrate-binding subunit
MSSRFVFAAGALLLSVAAQSLSAQSSSNGALRDTAAAKPRASHATSLDSALVELGRAISVLATTVQTVVDETAKNPEVRAAAVQTAGKAVSLAQRTLEENRGELERLLAEASQKLAAVEASERAKAAEKSKVTPSKP